MTGGRPKTIRPVDPDPTPTPILTEEVARAKKKVKTRKRGRAENILAGRMMQNRQILETGKRELGA